MIYTAREGQYITEVRVNGGENIAGRCVQFDPDEGWADVMIMNERGWPTYRYSGAFDSFGRVVTERLEGIISFVDTRNNANP